MCNLFSINSSLIFEFSIGNTRDTDLTVHPDLTTSSSFITYVPASPDLIIIFSLETNSLAKSILISYTSLFYLKEFYPTQIFFAIAIIFSSVSSQSKFSSMIVSSQEYISSVYFYSDDIDMVYLLQMIERRCRFDDEFELRRVEEPAF